MYVIVFRYLTLNVSYCLLLFTG